jgi:hypothetical protein
MGVFHAFQFFELSSGEGIGNFGEEWKWINRVII